MRGTRRIVVTLLVAIALTGSHGGPSRRTIASAEPALSPIEGDAPVVVEAPTPKGMAFVDRHPLFTKPREYYDSTSSNKFVKSAAAVVVGVPAGIIGELKQIVVGAPPDSRY